MQQNDGAEKWWISGMAEYPKVSVEKFLSVKRLDGFVLCIQG